MDRASYLRQRYPYTEQPKDKPSILNLQLPPREKKIYLATLLPLEKSQSTSLVERFRHSLPNEPPPGPPLYSPSKRKKRAPGSSSSRRTSGRSDYNTSGTGGLDDYGGFGDGGFGDDSGDWGGESDLGLRSENTETASLEASEDSTDEELANLSQMVEAIELNQEKFIPDYYQALSYSEGTSYAMLTEYCFVLQDWDIKRLNLKVFQACTLTDIREGGSCMSLEWWTPRVYSSTIVIAKREAKWGD